MPNMPPLELDQLRHVAPDQSWESHILAPITQNIGGGLATGLLLALAAYAWDRLNGLYFDIDTVAIWSAIAGGMVVCATTIIRFYADEIGLLSAAYRAGQASQQEEIQRLNRQISQLEQSPDNASGNATEINQRLGIMQGDYLNAVSLLKILLDGGNISRSSNEHGLGRRPWERAVALLEKSKIYQHETRQLLISSRNAALTSLETFWTEQYDRAEKSEKFQPAWW